MRRSSPTLVLLALLGLAAAVVSLSRSGRSAFGPSLLAQPPALNAPPVTVPRTAAQSSDVPKVERVLAARREYQLALEQLRLHYISTNELEKARWAEEELVQYHRITKRAYNLDLDVPVPTLQAVQNIPEANELYIRAMKFKDRGWGQEYVDNQHRAELLLQQLLSNYPQCNKIGDAAYQLGDLYENRMYKQYRRSALYYERCIQWTPNTQLDARIRAARIYDRYLLEQQRAIELYKEVLTHETDPVRLQEANARITALSGGR